MLPTEAFADVASFLGYYDLGGLKLANKLSCAVADQCASTIRVFDFSDFGFYVFGNCIFVSRLRADFSISRVCELGFDSKTDVAEFIVDAFRNCIVGRFGFRSFDSEHVLNALKDIAKTIILSESVDVTGCFKNVHELERYVGSYRHVKVCARDL